MINSGVIILLLLLLGNIVKERCINFCFWLNNYGNCELFLDENVLVLVCFLFN